MTDAPTAVRAIDPRLLDLDAVTRALRPFGEATMLPAIAYTSAEVLAWERRHLFAGTWTLPRPRGRAPGAVR